MQVSQLSSPFLNQYLSGVASHIQDGGAPSSQDVYNQIRSILYKADSR